MLSKAAHRERAIVRVSVESEWMLPEGHEGSKLELPMH